MYKLTFMQFLLLILSSYRLTHLIVFDKITEFIRKPFERKKVTMNDDNQPVVKKEVTSKFGYLLHCYWCAGIWCSAIITAGYLIIPTLFLPVILILAVAGAQSILESFVGTAVKATDMLAEKKADLKRPTSKPGLSKKD